MPSQLYVVTAARALSVLGNGIVLTALLLELHDSGAGGWNIAGLLAAGSLPVVLLAPVVGMLVDRHDGRNLIITSSLWQAAASLALAFAAGGAPGGVRAGAVLALVAASAVGTAVTVPVFGALTPLLVGQRQLGAATGVQQSGHLLALLVGPPVGGLLTGLTGGARVPLLLSAAAFTAVVVPALLVDARRRPVPASAEPGPPQARPSDVWPSRPVRPFDAGSRNGQLGHANRRTRRGGGGWGVPLIVGDGAVGAAAVLIVLLAMNNHVTGVAQVFLVRDTFQAGGLAYGLLSATQSLGVLFGTTVAGRLRTARRLLLGCLLTAGATGACHAGVGLSGSLVAVFALCLGAGVGFGMVSNAATTLVLLRMPNTAVGRALAEMSALQRVAVLAGQGLGGLLVGPLGPRSMYLLSGGVVLVMAVAMAVTLAMRGAVLPRRRGRAAPAPPPGRARVLRSEPNRP